MATLRPSKLFDTIKNDPKKLQEIIENAEAPHSLLKTITMSGGVPAGNTFTIGAIKDQKISNESAFQAVNYARKVMKEQMYCELYGGSTSIHPCKISEEKLAKHYKEQLSKLRDHLAISTDFYKKVTPEVGIMAADQPAIDEYQQFLKETPKKESDPESADYSAGKAIKAAMKTLDCTFSGIGPLRYTPHLGESDES